MTSPPARFEATVHVTRAAAVLTALLVIVLCLLVDGTASGYP